MLKYYAFIYSFIYACKIIFALNANRPLEISLCMALRTQRIRHKHKLTEKLVEYDYKFS